MNYTVTKVNAGTASYSVYSPISSGKRNISAVFLLKIIYLVSLVIWWLIIAIVALKHSVCSFHQTIVVILNISKVWTTVTM